MKTKAKPLNFLLLSLIFLFLIAAKSSGGDKVSLKLHLKKGDVFHYTMTTIQHISQNIKNQKIDIDQTMTFGYLMEVKDVDADGNYVVNATYDKIKNFDE